MKPRHPKRMPRWLGAYAERIAAARGEAARVTRVLERSSIPMVIVDGQRRYVEVNRPARLAFRLSLAELRRRRIDDLTPPHFWPRLEAAWARLAETGCVAGTHDVASPAGTSMLVTYYAMRDALPGRHLIAFVPANWPDAELLPSTDAHPSGTLPALTPRELEVLELVSEGHNAPMIAQELILSPGTVKTHLEHVYEKLGVRDRAAAVAKAIRLGLIL